MNEGNNKRFKVKGGIGAISSRLTVEGPLKKDKGSFIISGRRTYIDILMRAFMGYFSFCRFKLFFLRFECQIQLQTI